MHHIVVKVCSLDSIFTTIKTEMVGPRYLRRNIGFHSVSRMRLPEIENSVMIDRGNHLMFGPGLLATLGKRYQVSWRTKAVPMKLIKQHVKANNTDDRGRCSIPFSLLHIYVKWVRRLPKFAYWCTDWSVFDQVPTFYSVTSKVLL